jgi:hypothetical protein
MMYILCLVSSFVAPNCRVYLRTAFVAAAILSFVLPFSLHSVFLSRVLVGALHCIELLSAKLQQRMRHRLAAEVSQKFCFL